ARGPMALWALPLSGGMPRRVGDVLAEAAAWSPDGNTIAYSTGHKLHICKNEGSDSRTIASLPGRAGFIRWSPDGRRLRISLASTENGASAIWEVQAGGSNPRPLLSKFPGEYGDGQWMLNGKYFAFAASNKSKTASTDLWSLPEERGIL